MAPRILFIDDQTPGQWLIDAFLSGANFEVTSTGDPARAIDYARNLLPDAIVLDPAFAFHSGWETLAEIQSDPALAGIPVLVYTDLPESAIADHAARCRYDFVGYISKDDDLDHLLDRLAEAVGAPALTASCSA